MYNLGQANADVLFWIIVYQNDLDRSSLHDGDIWQQNSPDYHICSYLQFYYHILDANWIFVFY